jgi:hypothetical protein
MSMRRLWLRIYDGLLLLYPWRFRRRFAAEMMECAQAAEISEWPLIFADTSVGIVRCWFEGSHSRPVVAESNAYLALGESPVRSLGFIPGFVLSIAILVGWCYVSHWTACPKCPGTTRASARR